MATIQANFTSQHQPTGTHPPPQQSQETTKSKFSLQKPCHNIQISTPPRHTPQENKKANVKTFALWVGKLPTSRRYDLLPLLRSSPGGFARSWPYRTYPYTFLKKSMSIQTRSCVLQTFTLAKVVHFFHLSKHKDKFISRLPCHDQ